LLPVEPLDRLQEPLAALWWVEGLPCGVFDRHVQQRQESGQGRPEGLIQREELAGNFRAHRRHIIALCDLKVGFE
jgi:hypothetical protein